MTEFEWNHHFADVQAKGAFHSWHHRHQFASELLNGAPGALVRNQSDYSVGFGTLGEVANHLFVARQLRQTFLHRRCALFPG